MAAAGSSGVLEQDAALQDVEAFPARRPHDRRVSKTFATAQYMQGGPTAADKVKAYTQLPARYYSPDDECMKAKVQGYAKAQNFVMSFMRTSTRASISILRPEDLSPAPSSPSPCGRSRSSLPSGDDADGGPEEFSLLTAFLQSDNDDDPPDAKTATSPAAPDRCAWTTKDAPNSPTPADRCTWDKDGTGLASPHRARRSSVVSQASAVQRHRSVERKPVGLVSFSVRVEDEVVVDEDDPIPIMRSSKSFSKLASFINGSGGRTGPSFDGGQAEWGAAEDGDRELRAQASSQDFSEADNETQRLMAKAFGNLHRVQCTTTAGIEAKREKLGTYRQNAALPFNAYDWGCKNSAKVADVDLSARFKGKAGAKQNVLLGGLTEPNGGGPRKPPPGHTPEPLCLEGLMDGGSPKGASYFRSPDPMMRSRPVDDLFDFSVEDGTGPKLSGVSFRSPDPTRSRSSMALRGDWDGGGGSTRFSSMRTAEPLRSLSSLAESVEAGGRLAASSAAQQQEHCSPPVRSKSSLDLTSSPLRAQRRASILRPRGLDTKGTDGYDELLAQYAPAAGSGGACVDSAGVSLPPLQRPEQEARSRRPSFMRLVGGKRGTDKGLQGRER